MEEQLTSLVSNETLVYITGGAMMVAALMTMLPKPENETGVYFYIYKVLNFIAMNFGKASNK